MLLAEALIERADIQRKIEVLRKRMVVNAKTQEGVKPNETIDDLLGELNDLTTKWEYLVAHINHTNEVTVVEDGKTVSSLIAKKDAMAKKLALLGDLRNAGSQITERYSRTEIRMLPTFHVATLQKEIDVLAKELRVLDTKLQATNWTTELC